MFYYYSLDGRNGSCDEHEFANVSEFSIEIKQHLGRCLYSPSASSLNSIGLNVPFRLIVIVVICLRFFVFVCIFICLYPNVLIQSLCCHI